MRAGDAPSSSSSAAPAPPAPSAPSAPSAPPATKPAPPTPPKAATPAPKPSPKAATTAPTKSAAVSSKASAGKATPTNAKTGAKGTSASTGAAKPRTADVGARRGTAGGPTFDDVALGAESAELRALREAERELFPPAMPNVGTPWPSDLPSPSWSSPETPRVHASGLPPSPVASAPPFAEGGRDLSWLANLQMPDMPVRWDARLVRYLELFKDDARGRQSLTFWLRRSGRYRDLIRRTLRKKAIPEDLLWVAMVESGFDPTIKSPAGAIGLWQFMPESGRLYGLHQDRWLDERMSVQAATEAAAELMSDLYRRFGSWELALAAYNMGYGGVSAAVKKYNTNDYWALCKLEGSLPWETTLYVPKILAVAIVARNLSVFGYSESTIEGPIESDTVQVQAGTTLAAVATAAACTTKEVEALNPELRASRTPPPGDGAPPLHPVRVPAGKGAICTANLVKIQKEQQPLERYVVRFGESLEQICTARKISVARVNELNGLTPGEVVRGGAVLVLPRIPGASPASSTASAGDAVQKPVVVVPPDMFVYPDRQRVFYRIVAGDSLREIAAAFKVTVDDLRRWNDVDPAARLQEGMTLQIFAPADVELSKLVSMNEGEVNVLTVGTEDFFTYFEAQKGRKRISVAARSGDSLETIGRRYGVTTASMERINRRGRSDVLREGEAVVVYVPAASGAKGAQMQEELANPVAGLPNGALPTAPFPDALPGLPPANAR